jgi:glyoxylase-like metal-dependent hydrolase (beta-lactamase superfamily II)
MEFTRWQIGKVRVTKVVEAPFVWEPTVVIPDVTPEMVAALPWLHPHFVDDAGNMLLSVHALVVESEGRRILVDTCVGNHKERPHPDMHRLDTTFLADLEAAGFPPATFDTVCCTHLHVDHVGWNTRLLDGAWVPTFPNARHLFGRIEYDYWKGRHDTRQDPVFTDSVLPVVDAGLVDLVESDHRLTAEVRLVPTPGHTPGHHSALIESGGGRAIITGDMIHWPLQFAHPDLAVRFDSDAAQGARTRRAFAQQYADTDVLVIGTHFPSPTAGHIVRDGDVWRFEVALG